MNTESNFQSPNTSASTGQFRPASLRDFHAYAKHLAWLIETPLQRTQELLASVYGYSGLHELQEVMKRPGEPGPFTAFPPSELSNRIVDLIAAVKSETGDLAVLSKRDWKAQEIGLFKTTEGHRASYARTRAAIEIRLDKAAVIDRSVDDYAFLEVRIAMPEKTTEALFRFTPLGLALHDATLEILSERQTARQDLEALSLRHPNNPFVHAALVCTCVDTSARRVREKPEALFAHARQCVALFDELLGEHILNVPDYRLESANSDCFAYPASLYFGAVLARQCGDWQTAQLWAERNVAVIKNGSGFGGKELLGALKREAAKRAPIASEYADEEVDRERQR